MGSIGIFDSGVGGLTILQAIRSLMPTENIVYFADQKNVPYAQKSAEFLQKRSLQITKFLIKQGCSTIVIACNTATVAAITIVRELFPNIPIIGVEPAIKPASLHAKNKGILILATKHTLQSQRLDQLTKLYAANKLTVKKDMPQWVTLAENNLSDKDLVQQQVDESLEQFNPTDFDSIVLACTHYPIFKEYIQKRFPSAQIFDPSMPVANQVKLKHIPDSSASAQIKFYTSGDTQKASKAIEMILDISIKVIQSTI